jgi:hypothetical protein
MRKPSLCALFLGLVSCGQGQQLQQPTSPATPIAAVPQCSGGEILVGAVCSCPPGEVWLNVGERGNPGPAGCYKDACPGAVLVPGPGGGVCPTPTPGPMPTPGPQPTPTPGSSCVPQSGHGYETLFVGYFQASFRVCAGLTAVAGGSWNPPNALYGRLLLECGGQKAQDATQANPRFVSLAIGSDVTCVATWLNQSGTPQSSQVEWTVYSQ